MPNPIPIIIDVTINQGCSPAPNPVKCNPGNTIRFLNNTGAPLRIKCNPPPALAPPLIPPLGQPPMPPGGQANGTVTGAPGTYHYGCDTGSGATDDGPGIIIVDPMPPVPKPKTPASAGTTAPAATPKAKPKAKPKTKPKAKPKSKAKPKAKGRGKSKGGSKTAPKRKGGKSPKKKK